MKKIIDIIVFILMFVGTLFIIQIINDLAIMKSGECRLPFSGRVQVCRK